MNFSIEINQAIEWTVRLVAVCILIDTLEKFYIFREFKNGEIFSWERISQHPGFEHRRKIIRILAASLFNFRVWFFLLGLRGFSALILLISPYQSLILSLCLFFLFSVGSLANFRRTPFLPETPNRFTLTIIGALFLQSIYPTETVTLACLWFIALQSCLSYATAGIIKLFNQDWLAGNGLLRVITCPFLVPFPKLALFFEHHQTLGKTLNYLTILIECLFPSVLFIGKPFFLLFLFWGVLFHLTNVILLRFNNFFWAWIATYPAIIFIAQ